MKSKKMILAVFLGLLASSAALISSLFMLQQLKGVSTIPLEVEDLNKKIDAISVDVDVSPINKRIDEVVANVNELNNSVDTLEANQFDAVKANSSSVPSSTETTSTAPATSTTIDVPSTNDKPSTQTTKPDTSSTTTTEKKPEANTTKQKEDKKKDTVAKTTNRLNLRSQPGLKSSIVKTAGNGEKLTVIGESVSKDGYTWIKVKDSSGKSGWVAKKYTN